jgi:hypothetical protein
VDFFYPGTKKQKRFQSPLLHSREVNAPSVCAPVIVHESQDFDFNGPVESFD